MWLLHESYSNKYRKGNQLLSISLSASITMEFSPTSFPSAYFLFHRQQFSSLPSSASTITSPTLSATPESSITTIHRQPSLQVDFHRLSAYTVTFLLPISPLWSFWHVQKMVSTLSLSNDLWHLCICFHELKKTIGCPRGTPNHPRFLSRITL